MGFGLCNPPATFQTLMNEVLRPYLRKFVIVFLDDILIFRRTWDGHLEHVHAVLDAILRHQLYCKPTKCLIGTLEVLYLGHIITGTTVAPDWEKLKTLRDWPVPETVSQVRSFLGFVNFFRRFVPRYAEIAAPSDEVTGKNVQFSWNDGRQNSFDGLKTALLNPPVLKLADTSRPFEVYTDASDLAIGAVLMQSDDQGNHPMAYASRKLTAAEKNYTITERETLAVVFALKSWRQYLFKCFEIFTDNQAVVYLRSKLHMSKRKARWIEFLADFDFSTAARESSWSPGPERRQEDSGTSKDVSRPGIEPGSPDLASCAITARRPEHDTTGPRHRAFDVFQGPCYTILLPSARHPARASKPSSATSVTGIQLESGARKETGRFRDVKRWVATGDRTRVSGLGLLRHNR